MPWMNAREFRLTEQHLELLRRAQVHWDDSPQAGAPCIDPINPYGPIGTMGAASQVLGFREEVRAVKSRHGDIRRVPVLPEADVRRCWQLHRETEYALQIVLQFLAFEPGVYARHGSRWERIK